jgi:hypothetical protein
MEKIKALWNSLPKEVKVSFYIATSYGLSAVITELGKLDVSNVWLAIVINIVEVFFAELKPRIEKLTKK